MSKYKMYVDEYNNIKRYSNENYIKRVAEDYNIKFYESKELGDKNIEYMLKSDEIYNKISSGQYVKQRNQIIVDNYIRSLGNFMSDDLINNLLRLKNRSNINLGSILPPMKSWYPQLKKGNVDNPIEFQKIYADISQEMLEANNLFIKDYKKGKKVDREKLINNIINKYNKED